MRSNHGKHSRVWIQMMSYSWYPTQLKQRTPLVFQQTKILKKKPNPKNVKYLASIPLRFYYIPLSLQLTATGSAAESAGATEAKFRKTRIKCSSWWELLGGAPRALEHTLLLLGGSFAQHPHLSCTFWWIHGQQLLQSLHGKKVTGTMKKDEGM